MNANRLYCTFCGKSQDEVRKLIAGPSVFICDECIELCMEIIHKENLSPDTAAMGEAEYLSWHIAVRPPNSAEVLADALIKIMEQRGYSLYPPTPKEEEASATSERPTSITDKEP